MGPQSADMALPPSSLIWAWRQLEVTNPGRYASGNVQEWPRHGDDCRKESVIDTGGLRSIPFYLFTMEKLESIFWHHYEVLRILCG